MGNYMDGVRWITVILHIKVIYTEVNIGVRDKFCSGGGGDYIQCAASARDLSLAQIFLSMTPSLARKTWLCPNITCLFALKWQFEKF